MAKRQGESRQVQGFLNFARNPLQLMSVDEIYANADHQLLRELKEDRRIERKATNFGGDSLGEYFSMWANTSPEGGLIVIGQVDKTGEFEGCKNLSPEGLNKKEKTGHTFCPDAKFEVKRVPVANQHGEDDFILLFRVRYGR